MKSQGRWYEDIFHLYWADNTRTVLVIEFVTKFNWADWYGLMGVVREMVEGIDYPIVYVNIWDEQVKIPTDSPLSHFSNMRNMFLPQAVIVVMHNKWQHTFFEILARTIGFHKNETYWVVNTEDEALFLAQEVSQKLLSKEVQK